MRDVPCPDACLSVDQADMFRLVGHENSPYVGRRDSFAGHDVYSMLSQEQALRTLIVHSSIALMSTGYRRVRACRDLIRDAYE